MDVVAIITVVATMDATYLVVVVIVLFYSSSLSFYYYLQIVAVVIDNIVNLKHIIKKIKIFVNFQGKVHFF